MAEENIARQIGRFIYVEPTNLHKDGPDGKIPFPYEDYSISVNLTVRMKSRVAINMAGSQTLYFSSDDGTISFFGGSGGGTDDSNYKSSESKQGFLTTNWTNISNRNVEQGNKECLGISSIHIAYNSQYFPTITIKFIDLRGAALMMPQEQAFQNSISNKSGDITQMNGGSFFKALFMFPYPEFILSVKGFYGREVTYRLVVTSQQMEFNAQTGNFECTVDFMGSMYRFWADLPLPYIAIAPYYGDGGMEYWKQQQNNGAFTFRDGTPIPTFPELRFKITDALRNVDVMNSETTLGDEHRQNVQNGDNLKQLQDEFPLTSDETIEWATDGTDGTYLGYQKLSSGSPWGFNGNYPEEAQNYGAKIKNYIDKVNSTDFTSYNLNAGSMADLIPDAKGFAFKYVIVKTKKGTDTQYHVNSVSDGMSNSVPSLDEIKNTYPLIRQWIDYGNFSNVNKIAVVKVTGCTIKGDIDTAKAKIDVSNNEIQDALVAQKMSYFKELVGFDLSIGNIFKIVYAHLDTFMHYYYTVAVDSATTACQNKKASRLASTFGEVDVNSRYQYVPPFPAIYGNEVTVDAKDNTRKKVEIKWPADVLGKDIPETIFVTNLLKGAQCYMAEDANYSKELEIRQKELEERVHKNNLLGTNSTDVDYEKFSPLTIYDFAYNGLVENPYSHISKYGTDASKKAEAVLTTFFLRAYYFYLMSNKLSKKERAGNNDCAVIECYNLEKGLIVDSALKDALLSYNDGDKAWEFIHLKYNFGDRKIWEIRDDMKDGMMDYSEKDIRSTFMKHYRYNWLTTKIDDKNVDILPVGEFDVDTIKNDIANGDYYNSKYFLFTEGNSTMVSENDEQQVEYYLIKNKSTEEENEYFWDIVKRWVKGIDDTERVGQLLKLTTDGGSTFTPNSKELKKIYYGDFLKEYTDKGKITVDGIGLQAYTWIRDIKNTSSVYYGQTEQKGSLINAQAASAYTYAVKYCTGGYGTGSSQESPYLLKCYYIQDSDAQEGFPQKYKNNIVSLRKAYLAVFATPIQESYHKEFLKCSSCTVLNAELLRIGAYLWRREIMTETNVDPIVYHKNWKSIGMDEFPLHKDYYKLVCLQSGDYKKADAAINNYPAWQKRALIDYFVKWATEDSNGFKYLKSKCEWNGIVTKEEIEQYKEEARCGESIAEEKGIDLDAFAMDLVRQRAIVNFLKEEVNVFKIGRDDWSKDDEKDADENFLAKAGKSFLEEVAKIEVPDKKSSGSTSGDSTDESATEVAMDITAKQLYQNKDILMATYMSCKNLYDKWLAGKAKEDFEVEKNGNVYEAFNFMDSYYNDISDSFLCNANQLKDLLGMSLPTDIVGRDESDPNYRGTSVYEYLYGVAQKNGLIFMPIPMMYGMKDADSIEKMFKPWPYSANLHYRNTDEGRRENSEAFLIMYTYKPSEHLDIADASGQYMYTDDSYDIADVNGNASLKFPVALESLAGEENKIPAFGVTFAKQNQSLFKTISLTTKDQQVTEASIATTQNIASKAGEGPYESSFYGQDLYRVYANYAYSCTITMMGNAQIMPYMYFQLNNIPMWRGAYMIISVEHDITAGSMTTTFKGVRQSKYSVPFVGGKFLVYTDDGNTRIMGDSSYWKQFDTGKGYDKDQYKDYGNLDEMLRSSAAQSRNIDNSPATDEARNNLEQTLKFVNELRHDWGAHIDITSGYRNPYLNYIVGGTKTSAHMLGWAADLQPEKAKFDKFVEFIKTWAQDKQFDQIIIETSGKSKWVHIGLYNASGQQRRNIFNMNVS